MQYEAERREFTRVPITVEIEVASGEGEIISSHAEDVSLKGLYVRCDNPLPVGTKCQVVVYLGARDSELSAQATGEVVRLNDAGMGIVFTELIGTESLEHLRKLVLYNASDTNTVEREFSSHLGLRVR